MTSAIRRSSPAARLAAAFGVAALLVVVVVLSQQAWRDRVALNVLPTEAVVTLPARGASPVCTAVADLPSGAERAAFVVRAASTTGAAVRTGTNGGGAPFVAGPVERVERSGVVRPRLGPVRHADGQHEICVYNAGSVPLEVLGSGGIPALRLTGDEPEAGWSVLGAVVSRTLRAKGAPARWLGLPGVVVLLAMGGVLALVLVVRAFAPDWQPTRRTWAAVAAVALLHGVAWSVLTPPFQVPDEWSHLQYADYVADHGTLPNGLSRDGLVAPDQARSMELVGANGLPGRPELRPPWSAHVSDEIRRELAVVPRSPVPDGATSATSQPPLYYAVAGAVDAVAPGTQLDRLAQVRLVGVLALVALALGVVALARRLVPTRPEWALTAGLLTGLFPLVGFMAGGVTPDVPMLALATWTVVAALAFAGRVHPRTGLTLGLLGGTLGLVKLTTVALVPGLALLVLLALGTAIARGWPKGSTGGTVALGAGLLVPLLAYVVWCATSDRSIVPEVLGSFARAEAPPGGAGGGPLQFLNLTWQLYLPRLPGTADVVAGLGPQRIWVDGFVGRYGWLDYGLPAWVEGVLPLVWAAVALLGVRGAWLLLRRRGPDLPRRARVRRLAIGAAFVLLLLGVLLSVARADYTALLAGTDRFQQARYLLLAVPAAVALVLLALRGTPGSARPYVATTLVGVAVLHTVGSVLATVSRYYA